MLSGAGKCLNARLCTCWLCNLFPYLILSFTSCTFFTASLNFNYNYNFDFNFIVYFICKYIHIIHSRAFNQSYRKAMEML